MRGAGTFTVVNDKTLCEEIDATEHSLVYVAPGIMKPVVEAIGASLRSKPHLQVTAIIDLDPRSSATPGRLLPRLVSRATDPLRPVGAAAFLHLRRWAPRPLGSGKPDRLTS